MSRDRDPVRLEWAVAGHDTRQVDELTQLALAASEGDRSALERFVERSQADVYRFCIHLAGPDAAEELTQDTYLRAIPALDRFRGDSSARTWILSIARRAAVDRIRREVRSRRLVEKIGSTTEPPASTGAGSSVEVTDLLDRLDLDRREAFVLTQLLGFRYAEAADVVGCPVGTVRSRVARARADLLALVHDGDAEDGGSGDGHVGDGAGPAVPGHRGGNQRTGSDDY